MKAPVHNFVTKAVRYETSDRVTFWAVMVCDSLSNSCFLSVSCLKVREFRVGKLLRPFSKILGKTVGCWKPETTS